MQHQYIVWNSAVPTTAKMTAVATGTGIKTLLQVATPSTRSIKVIEWGISFDAIAAATPGDVELIQTDVAATSGTSVTPSVYGDPNAPAALCVGGTGATCFSPSAEGTITATRVLDGGLFSPMSQFVKQFPLGREPWVPISKFLRIRVHFAASVNALCYIVFEE